MPDRRLLLCVAVARRPLRVDELAEILAFDFEGPIPAFREECRLKSPVEAVLSTCSTLLSLVEDRDSQVVQSAHFSVKEFLTSTRFAEKRDTTSSRYHISMTPAHTLITQVCLGVLLHLDQNVTRDSLTRFPLAKYAAEHWFEHARFEGVSQNAEEGMKQLFDLTKPYLGIWVWIHDPTVYYQRREGAEGPFPPRRATSLHYAACCGLHDFAKILATEYPKLVNSQCFDGASTPLHLTSRKGLVDVARMLVERGAVVSVQDKEREDPVARGGVQYLWFGRGTDARGVRRRYVGSGQVREDPPAPGGVQHGGTHAPGARRRHFGSGQGGRTPLHLAASIIGSSGVARMLVERGADISAQDKHGRTPLHEAASSFYVHVTRMLLERGADMSVQDKHGRTPLQLASSTGRVDVAQILVECGADIGSGQAREEASWRALGKKDITWFGQCPHGRTRMMRERGHTHR